MPTYLEPGKKENIRHGAPDFPIQKYHTVLPMGCPGVLAHWHEEAELTLITDGSCTYRVELETYHVEAGDLVFLSPLLLHGLFTEDADVTSETFVFHLNLLGAKTGDLCARQYLDPLGSQDLLPPLVISPEHPAYREALGLFRQLQNLWKEKSQGYELGMKGALLLFLSCLAPHWRTAAPPVAWGRSQKLKSALSFIAAYYREDISIEDIAAACYLSQSYFMRFFKSYVGVSCGEYLKNYRLEKAAALLESGSVTIMDAAMESGFRNLSYFYREFRKKYGVPPGKFLSGNSTAP